MNFIKNLFQKKFVFKFKKSNKLIDVILLDRNHAKIDLKNYNSFIYDENKIYIFYLIKAFIKKYILFDKNNLKFIYFKLLFTEINPKIAIGHDIEKRIFDIKKYCPNIKTIVYQHGFYWQVHIERSLTRFKNCISDYFLIFDDWHKKVFANVKTKFIVSGSVRNNEKKIKTIKKKYDLMYISEFRWLEKNTLEPPNRPNNSDHKFVFAKKALEMRYSDTIHTYLLNILNQYCKTKKKKICVALVANRNEKKGRVSRSDEIAFFNQYLDNYYIEDISSHDLASKSKLNICISSNLGPELLSIGQKVLFLNVNTIVTDWHFLENKKEQGPFWYKGKNPEIITKKVDDLLKMPHSKFTRIVNQSKVKMMLDKQNKILNKIILKYI